MSDDNKVNILDENRIVTLWGKVKEDTIQPIHNKLLEFIVKDSKAPITLIVSSWGGSTNECFALIDLMESLPCEITTVAMGKATSAGALIACAGDKRVSLPRTEWMFHRFSIVAFGNYSDLLSGRGREDRLHNTCVDHLIRHSKYKTKADVEKHLLKDTDVWLSAKQAKSHGLVDEIWTHMKVGSK